MKEKIISASIKLLNNYSVKFTVDDIKNELKISKKTIYKYFENKEELAQVVFNRIIYDSIKRQDEIMNGQDEEIKKLIFCLLEYMEIYRLQSDKIFKQYSVNAELLSEVKKKGTENWGKIMEIYHNIAQQNKLIKIKEDAFQFIVQGIIKNIFLEKERTKIGIECFGIVLEKS